MKSFIVLVVIISIATAAKYSKPLEEHFKDFANEPNINLITDEDERPPTSFSGDVMQAKITSQHSNNGKGKFNYNFETQNGINIASIGKLKDEKTFVVSGSYSYTGADGKKYRVRYTADEFGYHPVTELEEIDPIQPIVMQTIPASDRTAKKFEQTGFGFNKNFYTVPTTKAPLKDLYDAPNNKLQAPLTSLRFGQGNLQAKNGPFSGPNSSLITKQFNQANGPAAVSSLSSNGFGQGNVHANGPFSAGISSLAAQKIGQASIRTNGPFSKAVSSFKDKGFGQGNIRAIGPFSAGISSLTFQQFGQGNIHSNRPFSALSNSGPNNFNGRTYVPPTESVPVNSRTYLPPPGYLPPQKNDFLFQ